MKAWLLTLAALPCLPSLAEEPWSVDARHPVLSAPAAKPKPVPLAARPLSALVRLYQKHVSPHDGPRCILTPTCSEYARQALAKRGLLMGAFLAAARLIEEHDRIAHAPVAVVHGHPRGWDPVTPSRPPPRGPLATPRLRGFQVPGRWDGDLALDARAWMLLGRKRRLP